MYGYEIFHENIIEKLLASVRCGNIEHAYIFEGAKGLAKHNASMLLATAITCQNKNIAPCGKCPSCIMSKAQTNPDIIHINSGDKKSISVDTIRSINSDTIIKPFQSDKKVYIVDEGDLLTESAQNAFLKTLEEPPSFITFIIVVENANILLQTVLSRCVLIRFSPVSESRIDEYIKEKYPNDERRKFLIKYSGGIPGVVDSVIGDEEFELLRNESFKALTNLIAPQKISAFEAAKFLEANKEKSELVLDFWLEFMRDIMMLQAGSEQLVINSDMIEKLQTRAGKLTEKFVVESIHHLIRAKQMQKRYVNTRALALNLAFKIKSHW